MITQLNMLTTKKQRLVQCECKVNMRFLIFASVFDIDYSKFVQRFSLDLCKGRISKHTLQISLKFANILPLRISSVLTPANDPIQKRIKTLKTDYANMLIVVKFLFVLEHFGFGAEQLESIAWI